jgi:threonine dehydrogenase-like Zn-dependent dehydrogenase
MRQLTFVAPHRLEWRDAPEPVLDDPRGALVRPLAVATCDLDRILIAGGAPILGPFALGHEGVGEVVAVGEAVESVRPGDHVSICFQISCGTCRRCRSGLTGSCSTTRREGRYAMFGLAPVGGEWGGFLSDLVRVPYADANLLRLEAGDDAAVLASLSDNMPDAWRAVCGPLARHPSAEVLVVGGFAASIGLYAILFASALGAGGIRYIDEDAERCRVAETLGAVVIQGPPPRRLPRAAVTVDASGTEAGLHCALRSTEPGGVCTSVAIYFGQVVPVPLLEMYTTGVTLETSRVMARPAMEPILALVRSGRVAPERVTSRTVAMDEAIDALLEVPTKLVMLRGAQQG